MGVGGTAGLLPACTDAPVRHLYAYLSPAAGVVPGVANWYSSTCRDCPAGCGVLVKTREGRPIKLEGHPASPINRGALCLRGQSAIQALYDPDRYPDPRIGRPGHTKKTTPEKAQKYVAESILGQIKPGARMALLTGGQTATSRWFYSEMAARWGAKWIAYEPIQFSALKRASQNLFGFDEVPRVDLSKADFILNLGADLFESWLSPVEHAGQLAQKHGFAHQERIGFVCMSPRKDLTAASADCWISVRPSSFGILALGLANQLLDRSGLNDETKSLLAGWLRPFTLEKVSLQTGCAADILMKISEKLIAAKMPLVLPPNECLLGEQASKEQEAILLLNYILGSVGRSVVYGQNTFYSQLDPAREVANLLQAGTDGEISTLVIVKRDPVYEWPDAGAVKKALEKIPLVVLISEGPNETSPYAHVVLPATHALEAWGDFQTRADWISVQQPVVKPPARQKQPEDWLIGISRSMAEPLAWMDYRQVLAQQWVGLQQQLDQNQSSTDFFKQALAGGGLKLEHEEHPQVELMKAELRFESKTTQADAHPWLLVYPSARLYDGCTANRPWIQEVPDALTQVVWDTPIEISSELAAGLLFQDGDRVKVAGAGGNLEATVRVMPGARHDVVAFPLGGGKKISGRFASGRGGRAWSLLRPMLDPDGGGLVMLQTRISLVRAGRGSLLTVEGDPTTHGRPIVPAVDLKDALKGRGPDLGMPGGHAPAPAGAKKSAMRSFYTTHEYPKHKWGMVVDLDLCTGCSACVLACQAENNIATVGPKQIRPGREMHWMRIERYWTELDSPMGPQARFIPIMCQHCDNAPCEPVCPVFASYHTKDGLNAQVYNRCIGTRYCANNCPYKVRRFNWTRHRWPGALRMQLNPDVTVRTPGVMEKCTFCIQRIREKMNLASHENRDLKSDEIVLACVQTCPTGALQFGDLNRPDSKVSRMAKDFRAYRLLDDYLNTKPAVSYLCKVNRNPFPLLG